MNIDPNQKKVVGLKQSLKAIRSGKAKQVLLAEDADSPIRDTVLEICRLYHAELHPVRSKALLGKACGIECSAAVVVLL